MRSVAVNIQETTLKSFTVFADAKLTFCAGINVLIGSNATGKTHLLKLLYAISACLKRTRNSRLGSLERQLEKKIINVFKPNADRLNRLIRDEDTFSQIAVQFDKACVRLFFGRNGGIHLEDLNCKQDFRSLFVPSKEILSFFPMLNSVDINRGLLSLDETYYDLISAMRINQDHEISARIAADFREMLGGEVAFSGTDFSIEVPGNKQEIEANLVSEGLRKIAMLSHLTQNGAISRNGILFWDEPESSLNPKYVTRIAKIIRQLSAMKVQVFLATHDYLLTRELSLAAEYGEEPKVPTRFFCFERENLSSPTTIETGERLADLEHNPILEEFVANYEHERQLFSQES